MSERSGTVRRRPAGGSGFTLLEMVFAIMIISTLAVLILPNYRKSQLKAQSAEVLGRIESINVSIKAYEADHGALLPFTGPVGSPPDFMASYMNTGIFAGPAKISFQLTKPDAESAPVLVINANGSAESQILLAAGAALGDRVAMVGTGQTITIVMSD